MARPGAGVNWWLRTPFSRHGLRALGYQPIIAVPAAQKKQTISSPQRGKTHMKSRHLGPSLAVLSACLALAIVSVPRVNAQSPELAQAAPAAPAAPPSWQQGRSKDQDGSTLAPHVPALLGTPAKEIPIDKAKLP